MKARILYQITCLLCALHGGRSNLPANSPTGIVYEVHADSVYADPESIGLDSSITNLSSNTMVVVLTGLHRIKLEGPDGKPVRPYPYHPSGRTSSTFAIECYPPGKSCKQGILLSGIFPFPKSGEYRCTLARRIYLLKPNEVRSVSELLEQDFFGSPLEVTATTVRFRVEVPTDTTKARPQASDINDLELSSLEYDGMGTSKYPPRGEGYFKSRQATQIQDKTTTMQPELVPQLSRSRIHQVKPLESKPAQTPIEEPASAAPWSIIVVLIVAATGLLWLLVKNRK